MPFGVTKECFPPASKCHNCERKHRRDILQNTETRETFQRCSGCHLLTYCDQDCQREHWTKVHKKHCNLLSGQKQVDNAKHNANTCGLCVNIYKERTSNTEIIDIASPKTSCHIEHMANVMKLILGIYFNFHEEGKTCKCSQEFACHFPFPLGELSGQYVGMGFDEIVSHSIKIAHAALIKKNGDSTKLTYLLHKLIETRAMHWRSFLVDGGPRQICIRTNKDYLSKPVDDLKVDFGPGNMWWKALKFSALVIESMNTVLGSKFIDSRGLEDPKYVKVKQIHGRNLSQLKNQAVASEKNFWSKFTLWPKWDGNSLVIVLPDGTQCQGCKKVLAGRFNVEEEEKLVPNGHNAVQQNDHDSILIPRVGEDGELVAFCSPSISQRCFKEFIDKDVKVSIFKYSSSQCVEEMKTFLIKTRVCDMCFKRSLSSHRCLKCKAVQYCSEKCNLKDFQSFHKSVCSTWAKDKFRGIIDAKHQKKQIKTTVKKYFKQ